MKKCKRIRGGKYSNQGSDICAMEKLPHSITVSTILKQSYLPLVSNICTMKFKFPSEDEYCCIAAAEMLHHPMLLQRATIACFAHMQVNVNINYLYAV